MEYHGIPWKYHGNHVIPWKLPQVTIWIFHGAARLSSSSSSTNFIATQVLNKTSGPLCVTCYTSFSATSIEWCCRWCALPYDLRNSSVFSARLKASTMAMVFYGISMVTMVLPWYSMEFTAGIYMNFLWSVTLTMVFYMICMAPMGFPWKTHACSFYWVSWYSMEIPWKPCHSMEVAPGHHMNFPWCSTMAMVFHGISMVIMVLPWYSMEFTAGFYMNFLWSVTLAMVFYIICVVPMVFPWNITRFTMWVSWGMYTWHYTPYGWLRLTRR